MAKKPIKIVYPGRVSVPYAGPVRAPYAGYDVPAFGYLYLMPFSDSVRVYYHSQVIAGVLHYAVISGEEFDKIPEGSDAFRQAEVMKAITSGVRAERYGQRQIRSDQETWFRIEPLFSDREYVFVYYTASLANAKSGLTLEEFSTTATGSDNSEQPNEPDDPNEPPPVTERVYSDAYSDHYA